MYRAVLDTNVFVSGGTISNSPPSQIIDHWRNQDFVLIVSPQLIEEYENVLFRPNVMKYTGLSSRETSQYIQDFKVKTEGIDKVFWGCIEYGRFYELF